MTLRCPALSRPRSRSRLLQVLAVTAFGLGGLSERLPAAGPLPDERRLRKAVVRLLKRYPPG